MDAQLHKLSELEIWHQLMRLMEAARHKQGQLLMSPVQMAMSNNSYMHNTCFATCKFAIRLNPSSLHDLHK